MKATVFGDSILKGVLLENGRYSVNREWEEKLKEQFSLEVVNRSRFGCTIRKAIPAIRKDCKENPGSGEVVVLEFGGNDSDFPWAEISENPEGCYQCKTPPEVFRTLYLEAVQDICQSGRKPVMITLPPIHSERYLRFICRNGLEAKHILQWLGDVEAISRWQEHYSRMIREMAEKLRIELIDLRAAFPSAGADLADYLCEDGIHPSRRGQELIYRSFCHALAPM